MSSLSLHDDFFDLGGQSLQAIQTIARLHKISGIQLDATAVFDQPTIAGLTALLVATGRVQGTSPNDSHISSDAGTEMRR